MQSERKYWFRAKRYGWGWGLPSSWQGWVVLAVFVVSLIVGGIVFPPNTERWSFTVLAIVLGGLLVVVCWLKGEPPRWRWGDDERA
jgi:lipoprotein signal peptidase